jgi:hypothetical protein
MPSFSRTKSKPSKKNVGCLAYFSTLKKEVLPSSETAVKYRTTRFHISDGNTVHCQRCDKLKSNETIAVYFENHTKHIKYVL